MRNLEMFFVFWVQVFLGLVCVIIMLSIVFFCVYYCPDFRCFQNAKCTKPDMNKAIVFPIRLNSITNTCSLMYVLLSCVFTSTASL